jgi:8-oxo-dGTP pyrophosphatase MutT (NUDIX family)
VQNLDHGYGLHVADAQTSRMKPRTQFAALPTTVRTGQLHVLLITSRETRRWVIPKGWPEKGYSPPELAAREAYEEAGIVGRVAPVPLGSYRYAKRLTAKKAVPCVVEVYLLEVERELDDWPERRQRERRWLPPAEAAPLVEEAGLADLLLRMGRPSD